MDMNNSPLTTREDGLISKVIAFCLQNKLVVTLVLSGIVIWGIFVAPFDWRLGDLPRTPVPVDAIPDIGENQQIVFTEWMGRSPQDIEDQVTYPLTSALLGVPGVKTIRSYSMFGFSNIYAIFEEDVDFYWSRTRILEKLNSLPPGTLPDGVRPTLGPDATPLGQVFWYTLEGMDKDGNPTGGWDLHELRSIQDWQVRYELLATPGVAEVASVGGFVQEYQVDVDPYAMYSHGVTLAQIVMALRNSNIDVGARTMEINRVEYVIRGLGFVKAIADLEQAVVKVSDNVPIRVRDVAKVVSGPALRRGALDKSGAEAVGGVVVIRYGANPLEVIKRVKEKIEQFAPSLPRKVVKVRQPDDSVREVESQVRVVPFYDRTGLIYETLGTLNNALVSEIMVTIIIVVIMLMHLRSSILISGLLPVAVLACFIAMKIFHVDANVVALSGIAIAIGTMVDMGIVLSENIFRHLNEASEDEPSIRVIYRAATEVGGAVLTAVATTVISFLPVFTMEAAEGKLFKPLAYTKTFALIASLVVALTLIPPYAHILFGGKRKTGGGLRKCIWGVSLVLISILSVKLTGSWFLGSVLLAVAIYHTASHHLSERYRNTVGRTSYWFAVAVVILFLTRHWMPIGIGRGLTGNIIFVAFVIGSLLLLFRAFRYFYERILRWCLQNKTVSLLIPIAICLFGGTIWLGFDRIFGFIPSTFQRVGIKEMTIRGASPWVWASHAFPGLGKEFMPDLDEGSFLLMPTTMPHASIGEAMDVLRKQDMALNAIPEVEMAVGKIGRSESPLDPAPISMIETIINYRPEYLVDRDGNQLSFKFKKDEKDLFRDEDGNPVPAADGKYYFVQGKFLRDEEGHLIPDKRGKPFRLWRPVLNPELNTGRDPWSGIRSPDDIWQEILRVTEIPGTTSAPKLQPIAARIVMLQSGMRAPMGVKIMGKGKVTLEALEATGLRIEKLLKEVPSVKAQTVSAERIVGKPYLEIDIDREAIARYGINVRQVQDIIETAIGGGQVTTTVEGRERYPVRVRYQRELRDSMDGILRILVTAADGSQIPLKELIKGGELRYKRGPMVIKSEDSAIVSYVLFDKQPAYAEVDVVMDADRYLKGKMASGELILPEGVSYKFAGSYENQVRSEKRLKVVLPLALLVIFLILYFQFRAVSTTLLVFSGIIIAWAGGFIMIWLYGQGWFFDLSVFGVHVSELFQMHPINLSVAIWVGFIALFGIATDNGVIMATYLNQSFAKRKPDSVEAIREATVIAANRRVRPCLMTSATTILALIPVLTSTGRGADIMVPMAIPSFGGMMVQLITLFVVPVLYSGIREIKFRLTSRKRAQDY